MNVDNIGRVTISILVVAAFLAYVFLITRLAIPPEMKDVVNTAGGILGSGFTLTINYWLGSSAGSSAKDKQIATMSAAPKAP